MLSPNDDHSVCAVNNTVAVVGAGVVGLCCALEAQRKGFNVTLIDRDEPGVGASFGNAGYLATELIDPLSTRKTLRSALGLWLNPRGPLALPLRYIHKVLPWLMRFAQASNPAMVEQSREVLHQLNNAAVPAWQRCLHDIGATDQLVNSGYLLVWESASKLEDAKSHAAYLAGWGVTTELVQGDRLKALEPELSPALSHGLYFPNAYQVKEPYFLSQLLFAAFQARGGVFIKQPVTKLEPQGTGVSVHTMFASLCYSKAIVCTGAWSKQLLQGVGLDVPIEAERGYHLTINRKDITLNHPIGSAERRFVMSPLDSGLRVVGITELGGLQLQPFKQRFTVLRHHSRSLLPALKKASDESEWMGHRPTLPDSLPVIDKHPEHQQLLFAFGNQHLGLTQAAISAELVVGLMTNVNHDINTAPFKVDRF